MVPPNADQSGLKAHESSGECEEGTGKSYEVSLLVMGPIPQWWAVVGSRIPAFLANAEKALAVPSRLESPSPSCNILQHLATSCNPGWPAVHFFHLCIGPSYELAMPREFPGHPGKLKMTIMSARLAQVSLKRIIDAAAWRHPMISWSCWSPWQSPSWHLFWGTCPKLEKYNPKRSKSNILSYLIHSKSW